MKGKRDTKIYQSELDGLPFHPDITMFAKICGEKGYKVPWKVFLLLHTLRAAMKTNNLRYQRSMEDLAAEMSASHATVKRVISFAQRHNLIRVEKVKATRMCPSKNRYGIVYPWNPVELPLMPQKYASKSDKGEHENDQKKMAPVRDKTKGPKNEDVGLNLS